MKRFAAFIIALGLASAPAMAQQVDLRSKLSLSATGEVTVEPDLAYVSSGVVSQAQSASAALNDNAEKMNRVMAELRAAGVAERDIQTANLSVTPVYSNNRNSEEGPRVTGYRASNQVTARLRDLDRVGAAIDAMVEAGANNVNNVSFAREDDSDAMDAARRQAMDKLLSKARLYAEAGGFELGAIYSLSENQSYRPEPYLMRQAAFESADAAPSPVSPGELTVSVTVNGEFGIQY